MWKRTKSHHHWGNNAEWFNIYSIIIIKGLIIARRNYCSLPGEACVCLDAGHFLRRHETIHNKNWILASFVDGEYTALSRSLSGHLGPEWISVSDFGGYSVDSFTIYCWHSDHLTEEKKIVISYANSDHTQIITLLFQAIFNAIVICRNAWLKTTRALSTKMREPVFRTF